jgi:alcohol dehydrogenase class IV
VTAAFEFATAGRILFGAGSLKEAAPAARKFGSRALVVTGRTKERAAGLFQALEAESVPVSHFAVAGEPTVDDARSATALARAGACDVVIAFGGGSSIDCAKAVAALVSNGGDPLDYIEVVGKGRALTVPSIPFIAIPTTAGAGAEVTRNAVLASPEHRVKASLRSPFMLARLAIVDPELTLDLPPEETAVTGLDALTQLIEPYVSIRANAMVDAFCLYGIGRAATALPLAFAGGRDLEARTSMSLAALYGGLALANAGLGGVHGFAAPIGGAFDAPHGAVCAALLPAVMDVNIRALKSRAPGSETLRRYETVARMLTGDPAATLADGIEHVRNLARNLGIPGLRRYGITESDVSTITESAARASSMKANPIVLTREELEEVLVRSL